MKLIKTIFADKNKKRTSNRNNYADYYQKNLNSFGKDQMQTLIKKGISLSW